MPDAARTLYASRPLLNADEVIAWATSQGLPTTMPAENLHVTLCYSKEPLVWPVPRGGEYRLGPDGRGRSVERFGDKAVVLRFEAEELSLRAGDLRAMGAHSDFPDFRAHVTITYNADDIDVREISPYTGRLVFGPEVFAEVDDSWEDSMVEKNAAKLEAALTKWRDASAACDLTKAAEAWGEYVALREEPGAAPVTKFVEFAKVVPEKGQAFGVFSVADIAGQPVVDWEGDQWASPDELEKSAYDHVIESRSADENHDYSHRGDLIESMVFTPEKCAALQKALRDHGIEATIDIPATVWWGGHQITDQEVRKKVASGEYRGFSMGGRGVRTPVKKA